MNPGIPVCSDDRSKLNLSFGGKKSLEVVTGVPTEDRAQEQHGTRKRLLAGLGLVPWSHRSR